MAARTSFARTRPSTIPSCSQPVQGGLPIPGRQVELGLVRIQGGYAHVMRAHVTRVAVKFAIGSVVT